VKHLALALLLASCASAQHVEEQSAATCGSRNLSLGGGAHVDIVFAMQPLGPKLCTLWMNANYLSGTHLIGQSTYHSAVQAGSCGPVSLSTHDLDVTIGKEKPSVYRSFDVFVEPRPGLTWGEVGDFQRDIVIVAKPR
jgi:hypothetical protein